MDWRTRLSPFCKYDSFDSYFLIYTGSFGTLFPFAIMNTTIQTETELSSVNSILIAIGQAPVTRLCETDEEPRKVQYTHEEEMCGTM